MAKFSETIEILVNTQKAKDSLSDFGRDLNAVKEYAKSLSNAGDLSPKLANVLVDQQKLIDAYNEQSKVLKAQYVVRKALDEQIETASGKQLTSLQKQKAALEEQISLTKQKIDANPIAQDVANDFALSEAKNQNNAMNDKIAAAGLSDAKSKAESAKSYFSNHVESFDNDADAQSKAVASMQERLDLISAAAKKYEELNALQTAGLAGSKRALELQKEYNDDMTKIKPSQGKDSVKGVKAGLSADFKGIADKYKPSTAVENFKKKSDGTSYNTVGGAAAGKLADFATEKFKQAIKKIGEFFVSTFKEAFASLSEMAKSDAGTTLFSSSTQRTQQLEFGLTGSQNYAMTKAMSMLNMQSTNDLLWMNEKQSAAYSKLTTILQAQYDKLESSGILATAQEVQLDISMMKLQFQNSVYQFIAAHKNQIVAVMDAAMKFMSGMLEFAGWIIDGIAAMWGNNGYSSADILSTSSTSNSNTTNNSDNSKNVTTNATVYVNGAKDSSSEKAISGELYNQIIVALGG